MKIVTLDSQGGSAGGVGLGSEQDSRASSKISNTASISDLLDRLTETSERGSFGIKDTSISKLPDRFDAIR